MGLGLLLVPALAGYLFLNWFNGTRYSLPRETGYHVVFQSAIAGVLLFFVARLLVVLANTYVPDIAECWKTIVPLDYSGTAAGTFVLAALLPIVLNRLSRFDRFKAREKAAEAAGDQISLIIDQAMLEGPFRRTLSSQPQVVCRFADTRYLRSSRRRRRRPDPYSKRLPQKGLSGSRPDH